jgi:hypothetical protein
MLNTGRGRRRAARPFEVVPATRHDPFSHAYVMNRRAAELIGRWMMRRPIDLEISKARLIRVGILCGDAEFLQRSPKTSEFSIHKERRGIPIASGVNPGVMIADCACSPRRGIGNHITVICSAYASAVCRGWETVVVWQPRQRSDARWEDMFKPIEGVEILEQYPKAGYRHREAYYSARSKERHLRACGLPWLEEKYWIAWREMARKIILLDELALPEVPPFSALSLRLAHPRQEITDWWAKAMPDLARPFITADCQEAFDIAMRRFPDAWFLCDKFQKNDSDRRGREHMRSSARDMMMLCQAERMFTVGRESTFRNLAHLGCGVPVMKTYSGKAP